MHAGVVPSMDIVETASSNASSEDMLLFDESPKRHKHLDGFYPSHDTVQPPPAAAAANASVTRILEYACGSIFCRFWALRACPNSRNPYLVPFKSGTLCDCVAISCCICPKSGLSTAPAQMQHSWQALGHGVAHVTYACLLGSRAMP